MIIQEAVRETVANKDYVLVSERLAIGGAFVAGLADEDAQHRTQPGGQKRQLAAKHRIEGGQLRDRSPPARAGRGPKLRERKRGVLAS